MSAPLTQTSNSNTSIFPLVTFRVAFGLMMFLALLRFWWKGWIHELYIKPSFFFSFYGFEWVKVPTSEILIYGIFILLLLSAAGIALGFLYRISSLVFFLCFTYVELWDKSNYLNHYYFVSLVALLLCLVPAHRLVSLDVYFNFTKPMSNLSVGYIRLFQVQMALVYFFAGIAKINSFWLFEAMPLRMWLPLHQDLPLLGPFLQEEWLAFAFSWIGMLFDTLIPFFLFYRKTVYPAYLVVLIFHILTAVLFPVIGMFPFIMMVCATVFLPPSFHQSLWKRFSNAHQVNITPKFPAVLRLFAGFFFFLQVLLAFRYLAYPGELFWTEQGYRFSWRVMLMEKAGTCTFLVKDQSGKMDEINNRRYLTMQQEKMMATQPDMILQFAHYLGQEYRRLGYQQPQVFAESWVSLQGRPSQLLLDPSVDLLTRKENFHPKDWLLPWKP
ncbi:MAG: HTTM domain-containing protein [Cytophagaceae bacterium]|jgi:hypothetical protein|nr:HTTM domain-containing protein [Cytophagaceae bacterium]